MTEHRKVKVERRKAERHPENQMQGTAAKLNELKASKKKRRELCMSTVDPTQQDSTQQLHKPG
jgi:hypothetical protein